MAKQKRTEHIQTDQIIARILKGLELDEPFTSKGKLRKLRTSKPYYEVRVFSKDLYDAIHRHRQDQNEIFQIIRNACPGLIAVYAKAFIPSNAVVSIVTESHPEPVDINNLALYGLMIHFTM
jgi:hypothetical protein